MKRKERGEALASVADVGLDIARIGVPLIPLVGSSITEAITVLEERRRRRAQRFWDRLLTELGLGDGKAAEERLRDERMLDLMDHALESAAQTRSEEHVDLLARIVADALQGHASPERLDGHHYLVRMARDLGPSHLVILTEIATCRLRNGRVAGVWPTLGIDRPTSALAERFPDLADLVEPIVGDLLAAGLVMFAPAVGTEALVGGRQGTWFPRKERRVELAPYGKWVLEQLRPFREDRANTPSSGTAVGR